MAEQSYESHAHHPVPTYIASGMTLLALFVLVAISRLYTVALQDRIIMLEMKVRCAELLSAGQDANLAKLSNKQIAALRFASDDELGALLERAVRENLSPKDIKASIRAWRPDPFRT